MANENEKGKYGGKGSLEVCISGPKLLGGFYFFIFFLVFRKRQLKRKPSGKCHCTIVRILNRVLQMNL